MADDPIGRGLLLLAVIVFAFVARRPEWAIKVLSYGRYGLRDINGSLLRATRIVTAVSAISGAAYLVWGLVRK